MTFHISYLGCKVWPTDRRTRGKRSSKLASKIGLWLAISIMPGCTVWQTAKEQSIRGPGESAPNIDSWLIRSSTLVSSDKLPDEPVVRGLEILPLRQINDLPDFNLTLSCMLQQTARRSGGKRYDKLASKIDEFLARSLSHVVSQTTRRIVGERSSEQVSKIDHSLARFHITGYIVWQIVRRTRVCLLKYIILARSLTPVCTGWHTAR